MITMHPDAHPTLPRRDAIPGTEMVPSFEGLARANLLRYAAGDPAATVTVSIDTGDTPAMTEQRQDVRRYGRRSVSLLAASVVGMFCGFASFHSEPGFLTLWGASIVAMASAIPPANRAGRIESALRRVHEHRVPVAVHDAYARLVSAREEAETGEFEADSIASLRLMEETGRDLTLLVAEHHEHGTGHGVEAVEARGELFRLAAEADALVTLAKVTETAVHGAAPHPAILAARQMSLSNRQRTDRDR